MSDWLNRAKRALNAGSSLFVGRRVRGHAIPHRRVFAFEPLEPRLTLAAAGLVPVGTQPAGNLSGKIVYTTPGHGWNWSDALGRWATDRGENNDMVEDFGTQDQFTFYVDYLFRAGATVVPMRPVGRQTNEVVLDNDMTQVTYSGSWTISTTGTRWYDEDYGAVADTDRYRFASTSATETATATYTPNIPASGFYPVYTWASPGSNRTSQLYKINHSGGQTQVRVDHSLVGNGWVYLGTYHFDAGSSSTAASVVITNQGTTGKVVIADAIRFGNGMGDLKWGSGGPGTGSVSGFPREDEHSYAWVYQGLGEGANPDTTFDPDSPFTAPAIMAGLMNSAPYGTSVYMGFHSNAFSDPAARGATGLFSTSSPTPHQSSLATYAARQIETDMLALGYSWGTRTYASGGAFGEINNAYYNDEMDSIIIEVAFHTNPTDAEIMRDPVGRDQIARSVYEGTVEYFANWGTVKPANITLPSAPTNVRAVSNSSGQVTINWAAGASSSNGYNGANGSAATGFRIYASSDGFGFDGGILVSGAGTTSATLTGLDPALPYYFRVVAVNTAGESKPTEVVAALPSGGVKQVLIVSGFDRFDLSQDFDYAYSGGFVDRVWPRYNNSFDYVVQVATAIQGAKPGVHVASTSNEAVISGAVNLTDYDTVVWISGTESTDDDTFNATEQSKVTAFINAGGNFFASGAEIGWDLDQQNNGRTFYESTLKANYVSDDAGTYAATADAAGIFTGMSSFAFSNGSSFSNLDSQYYNVAYPDVIAPQAGAISALTYSGGTGGSAAIQVSGTGGKGSIVLFGFPFEAMTSTARRQTAMGKILDFFSLTVPVAGIDIKTRVDGQDADTAPGPTLTVGSSATFTYIVTNTGNVPNSAVVVKDNNGTPGNAADDFSVALTSGDSNANNQLDVGETWTYTATRTVTAGQYTTTGNVTATGNVQSIADSDFANYLGVVPPNADFNNDGTVDSSDYPLWRRGFGITSGATRAQGDANSDGAVNATDYAIWRAQFGTTFGLAAGAGGAAANASLAEIALNENSQQSSAISVALSPAAKTATGSSPAAQNFAFSGLESVSAARSSRNAPTVIRAMSWDTAVDSVAENLLAVVASRYPTRGRQDLISCLGSNAGCERIETQLGVNADAQHLSIDSRLAEPVVRAIRQALR